MTRPTRRRPAQDGSDAPADPTSPPAAADAPEGTVVAAPDEKTTRKKRLADLSEPERRKPQPIAAPTSSPRLSGLEDLLSGDFDMDALMAGGAGPAVFTEGDKVEGTITRITRAEISIDLGSKAEAWMEAGELPAAKVGDVISAYVVNVADTGMRLARSLQGDSAAAHLEDAVASGVPITGKVTKRNPGGYEVSVGSVRAFCPGSLISRLPLADPDSVVGLELSFLVLEADEKTVLSRRALQEKEVEESAGARWEELQEGDVVEAIVTSAQGWGAFVDVDGIEGRIPKHELSWTDVGDVRSFLSRGQKLQLTVTEKDHETRRLGLSGRDPNLDPWQNIDDVFQAGNLYTGKVVRVTDFGAFIELAPGYQGLMHKRWTLEPPDTGAEMEVRLLSVDAARRRLELAPANVDPAAQVDNTEGTEVTGVVMNVIHAGVAVTLDDGRRAWLPEKEVPLPAGTVLAQRFRRGRNITARVLSVDGDRGQVLLSQREDDSNDRAAWAQHVTESKLASKSMGTFGDLLSNFKK